MRVLSVGNRYPPWSTGGYEVTWAGAMGALRAGGHETRVLTTLPDPTDRSTAPPAEGVYRELRWYWRANEFPPIGLRECIELERSNSEVLRRHVASFKPDVIMWWAMGGMSLSLIAQADALGLPALAAVGDDWIAYGPIVDRWTSRCRSLGGAVGYLLERLTGIPRRPNLEAVTRWAFNSRYTLATARSQGWRLESAAVVHPGVDLERFAPRPAQHWRWRLLYCGRIDPRKGISTAIEALPLLPAEASLAVHGDGDDVHQDELAALADRLRVGDRVSFGHSEYEQIPDVYADADAVVFPVSWQEPWGLVPLEAMAIGRPVVATRAGGGAAEYLRDGQNCLQFEPRDASGLAAAVRRLADAPDLRDELTAAGHSTAARYTEQSFYDGLERELRLAVAGARERADTMGA